MNTLSERKQKRVMWLCWTVYVAAYLGRYSYQANVNLIMADYGADHAEAGLVATFFFFAYGAGQIIHGLLCRKYPERTLIPLVLAASAALNLPLYFGAVPFPVIKYLWFVNGLLQSVLWPLVVLLLSRNLDEAHLHRAILLMSTTTSVGTLLAYGGSAAFVRWGSYRLSFLTGCIVPVLAGLAWLLLYSPIPGTAPAPGPAKKARSGGKLTAIPFFLVLLGFFAAADNFMKDGLQTWVPAILKETYRLPDDLSIILSLVLPVLGIFGAMLTIAVNRRIKGYVPLAAFFFGLSALLIACIRCFSLGAVLLLAAMGCVVLLAHAINNVVTALAPLELRSRFNSGTIAGVLNGCCYVGSTVSTYALGTLADRRGWNAVFSLLLLCAATAAAAGLAYSLLHKNGRSGG